MSKKRDSHPAKPDDSAVRTRGEPGDRRRFLEKVAAVGVGGVVSIAPLAAGIYTFLDPLCPRKRPGEETGQEQGTPGKWVKVALLADVPPGAPPQRFPVITDSWDAWNYYPPHPVGAVYLSRVTAADDPVAFTATCPHLGCTIKFQPATNSFACPCHDSVFTPDGTLQSGVAPRDMDRLEVQIRQGRDEVDEVWVKFLKFRAQKADKIPEA